MLRSAPLICLFAVVAVGCKPRSVEPTPRPSTAPSLASASAPLRSPKRAPIALEQVEVPGGAFDAGSRPGSKGRKPRLEQEASSVELGPFQMDRLPYPNDPGKVSLVNVSRDEARTRCAERGARLCTELEWERACRGPSNDDYPSGSQFDPRCVAQPSACATGFDLLGLGLGPREWTASDMAASEERVRGAVVRGGAKGATETDFRCARREPLGAETRTSDIGFRCCRGAPNAARVEEPKLGKSFTRHDLPLADLVALLRANPRTRSLAEDVTYFKSPDAANTVVERGSPDRQGLEFGSTPLLWNPAPGAEYLLVTARSGKDTSFVVAFYATSKHEFSLAASFVMKGEPGPVAFAYADSLRSRLFFTPCWRCAGENGRILYRDPDTVALVQP